MRQLAPVHPPIEPDRATGGKGADERQPDDTSRPASPSAAPQERPQSVRPRELTRIRMVPQAPEVTLLQAAYTTHRFTRHSHEEMEIAVNASGSAKVSIRGRSRRLEPDHVLLAGSYEPHSARPAGDEPWQYRAILVPPSFLRPLAAGAGIVGEGLRFRVPIVHDPALAAALLDLHRLMGTTSGNRDVIGRVAVLMTETLRRYARSEDFEDQEAAPIHPAIQRVREHLDTHFARSVSLEELAELVDLSPFHLLRIFRDTVGLPPNAYQQCCRIRSAQRLLRAGRPIAKVAVEVGFASASHLTRQFKKIVGAPPGVWVRGVRPKGGR
jgi:AraC-like DNA-binding protein/mannose-6-phosphate isomerase-like protein (cupin superfamily)